MLNVLSEWFECGMICLRRGAWVEWAIWVWVILNILNVSDIDYIECEWYWMSDICVSDMTVNYRRRKAATMTAKGTADPPTSYGIHIRGRESSGRKVGGKWGISAKLCRRQVEDKRRQVAKGKIMRAEHPESSGRQVGDDKGRQVGDKCKIMRAENAESSGGRQAETSGRHM